MCGVWVFKAWSLGVFRAQGFAHWWGSEALGLGAFRVWVLGFTQSLELRVQGWDVGLRLGSAEDLGLGCSWFGVACSCFWALLGVWVLGFADVGFLSLCLQSVRRAVLGVGFRAWGLVLPQPDDRGPPTQA